MTKSAKIKTGASTCYHLHYNLLLIWRPPAEKTHRLRLGGTRRPIMRHVASCSKQMRIDSEIGYNDPGWKSSCFGFFTDGSISAEK